MFWRMRKKICFHTWGREAAYGKKNVLLRKNGIARLQKPHEEKRRTKYRLSVSSESMFREPVLREKEVGG